MMSEIKHAIVIKRTTTTDRRERNFYLVSSCFEHFNGGYSCLRMKVVIEGVRPENDFLLPCRTWIPHITRFTVTEPLLKGLRGEGGDVSFRRKSPKQFDDVTQYWCLCEEIHQTWHERSGTHPPVNQPHAIASEGPQSPLIIVRKELCLIGRHIDVDRAIPFTAFTGKTVVQCILHCTTTPSFFQRIPLSH